MMLSNCFLSLTLAFVLVFVCLARCTSVAYAIEAEEAARIAEQQSAATEKSSASMMPNAALEADHAPAHLPSAKQIDDPRYTENNEGREVTREPEMTEEQMEEYCKSEGQELNRRGRRLRRLVGGDGPWYRHRWCKFVLLV